MEYNPLLLTQIQFGGQRIIFTGVSGAGKTRIFKKLLFDYLSVNQQKRFVLVVAKKDKEVRMWKKFFGKGNPYVTVVPKLFKKNEKGRVVENEVLHPWADRNKGSDEAEAIEKLVIVDDQGSLDPRYALERSSWLSDMFNVNREMNFTVFLMAQRRVMTPTGLRSQASININLKEGQSGKDRANAAQEHGITGQFNGKPTLYATMMTALVENYGHFAGKCVSRLICRKFF